MSLTVDASPVGNFLALLASAANVTTTRGDAIAFGDKSDARAIVDEICKGKSKALAGEPAVLNKWFALLSAPFNQASLGALNDELGPIVYLSGSTFTAADLALFTLLQPVVAGWNQATILQNNNISRYVDNLQYVLKVPVFFKVDQTGGSTATPAVAAKPSAAPTGDAPAKAVPAKQAAAKKQPAAKPVEEAIPDFARVDLRVGRVLKAWKHPEADGLYCEEIDVGEATPRQVCSGLVGKVPLEEVNGSLVVCVCNLKPVKMRGVMSQAMVLAASSADGTTVELVCAKEGTKPGDRVFVDGIKPQPEAQLNPKKQIWEKVCPLLITDDSAVATYDGKVLKCSTGPVAAKTVKKGGIK